MKKSKSGKEALVFWGATDLGPPHFSGDILWRTGFKAPDPFLLVEIEDKVYLLLSSLELERAAKECKAGIEVINAADYKTESGGYLENFLKKHGVKTVVVPGTFPCEQYEALKKSFKVIFVPAPFYPARAIKTDWEVAEIEKAQRAVEKAVSNAVKFLGACGIVGESIVFDEGTELDGHGRIFVTSEILRKVIDDALYAKGYLGIDTIVSCGAQAADPHCAGSGPLQAHQPIVMDVFPLSMKTHYYADMTRTVFKGRPSDELIEMYYEVMFTQDNAIHWIKAGVDGHDIYERACVRFEAAMFPTELKKRPLEGFIHGVGHGVGIDIHEPPSIGGKKDILQVGNVVTVEPGLYYSRARDHIPVGGIRIEDMVLVTKDGCRNLTQFPKDLESMIIL
ncbi:MAG: Xaa-Pro peptidase family protein [bacterium]|nr:Xaa-Pro peptidase family protein [bacterium]